MRITYLTAGASGMYCGSCMHDNTLARALTELGHDVQLVPMYTPILTDEVNMTVDQVFFGGINIYLQQKLGLFRYLPRALDRVLDWPRLLRWVGSRGVGIDASQLGDLTVSILQGSAGFQRKEVARLCQWLRREPRPDLLNLSNVLIAGCVPELRAVLQIPITVTLQGDDIFLDELTSRHRSQAVQRIRELSKHVDAFLVHSQYYAEFMAQYLSLPREKFRQVPLGIDITGYSLRADASDPPTEPTAALQIGYLARLAPEKGLHVLVDAFLLLRQMPGTSSIRLLVAGWSGKSQQQYVAAQFAKLRSAGLDGSYEYWGIVDRQQKLRLLSQVDLFSVPSVYQEPKGLYVLEAMAAGTPVVQPNHGAFPELLGATGGGELVAPNDPQALAQTLHRLLCDPARRRQLGLAGQQAVHQRFNARVMAQQTLDSFRRILACRA